MIGLYQIENHYKIINFHASITMMNVIYTFIHAIKALMMIDVCLYRVFLFIVIYGTAPQTSTRNVIVAITITIYGAFDTNIHKTKLYYSMENKINDFNPIANMNIINTIDSIMHLNKLLSVMYAIITELIAFIIHSTLDIKIYINMIQNWILSILCEVQCIIHIIWSLIIIIIFEFYIKLCILIYLHEKISVIPTFQGTCNHSLITHPHINNHLLSPKSPLNIHSISPYSPLSDPSTRHHRTVLTTSCFQHIGYVYESLLMANLTFQWVIIISYPQYIFELVNNSDTTFTTSHKKSDEHATSMMSHHKNIYIVIQPPIDDMGLIQLMCLVPPIIKPNTNDLLSLNLKFIIIIGCDLGPFDLTAMRINIYDRIRYSMDQIKVGVDVCNTFNGIAFVIDNFVEILTLTLLLNAFAIIFDGITVDSDKLSEFKYNYLNNNNIIVSISIFCLVGSAAIVIGFFLDVAYFVTQLINESSLIDCLLYKTVIISFTLKRILLKMTLSMTKQLHHWCCQICNVIRCWILWNYSLGHTVTVYNHNDVILDTIDYMYIICIIVYAIQSNRNNKLHTKNSGSYKLNQNKIIGLTVSYIAQAGYEINNFDIYAVTREEYLYIVIDYIIPQTAMYLFMLPFKFNTGSNHNDLLSVYLTAIKIGDCNLMIVIINSKNTSILQVDHSYVILIQIRKEWLIAVVSVFKLCV